MNLSLDEENKENKEFSKKYGRADKKLYSTRDNLVYRCLIICVEE